MCNTCIIMCVFLMKYTIFWLLLSFNVHTKPGSNDWQILHKLQPRVYSLGCSFQANWANPPTCFTKNVVFRYHRLPLSLVQFFRSIFSNILFLWPVPPTSDSSSRAILCQSKCSSDIIPNLLMRAFWKWTMISPLFFHFLHPFPDLDHCPDLM